MWKQRWIGLALAGLVIAGTAAGCSTSDKSASSASGGVSTEHNAVDPNVPGAGPEAGTSKSGSSGKAGETALSPSDVQRSIIYSGAVTIRVKDVDAAAGAASGLATGAGGYVGGDNRDIDATRSTATLTLRVPSANFYSTITALDRLGQPQSRNVSTQDVTEQVIDVQSRLKTEQASVDRIRTLIAGTTSIGQIVALENELTQRESDLESMEAQLRSLTDLTTLSTITVTLLGPEARVAAVHKPKRTGFLGGLSSGWDGFVKSLTVLLTVLGAVLPFAVAIGIPVAVIVWFVRRRRRSATPVTADAAPQA